MTKRLAKLWREASLGHLQSAALLALSVFLALLFWAFTVSEDQSLRDLSVPLEFVDVPENMAVAAQDVPRTITVQVKGSPELLRRVREEDLDAKVNVAKLQAGPQFYELGRDNVRLPSFVEFARVTPDVIHFSVERRSRAEVPLEPAFTGRTAKGTQVLSWTVDPSSTRLEGPESVVTRIQKAQTQPVSVEGRNASFSVPVVPVLADPAVKVLDTGPFSLSVVIGEKRAQRTISPVPIALLNSRYSAAISPTTLRVMVDGPASVIGSLGPGDLVAELNLVGLKPADQPYQLLPAVRLANPVLASRIEITSWTQHYVEVRVEKAPAAAEGTP